MLKQKLESQGPSNVSMKSGLEGRNNPPLLALRQTCNTVSMKSGLEGRNNTMWSSSNPGLFWSLNEVRPRRPEQSGCGSE